MMIGGVSSVTSTMTAFNPVLVAGASPGASSGVTALTASAKDSLSANAPTPAPSRASAQSKVTLSAAPASAAVNSIADEMISPYSTMVAGKQYSGSVEESGGDYSAWVPNLARATVTGPSEQAAENNLYARIDELV